MKTKVNEDLPVLEVDVTAEAKQAELAKALLQQADLLKKQAKLNKWEKWLDEIQDWTWIFGRH